MKKVFGVMIFIMVTMLVQPFVIPVKAATVSCYCGFWGTCKVGGNGGLCFTYDSAGGGSCTSQNGNCGLFNPGDQ